MRGSILYGGSHNAVVNHFDLTYGTGNGPRAAGYLCTLKRRSRRCGAAEDFRAREQADFAVCTHVDEDSGEFRIIHLVENKEAGDYVRPHVAGDDGQAGEYGAR